MRERVKPFHRRLELFLRPRLCEITTVEKDVTIWNVERPGMCIAYAYEARPGLGTRGRRGRVILEMYDCVRRLQFVY